MQFQKMEITFLASDAAARRAASDAFGLDQATLNEIHRKGGITLVVTPHQFGTFVALRNIYGGENWIKALNPKLIPDPRKLPDRIDVTGFRAAA